MSTRTSALAAIVAAFNLPAGGCSCVDSYSDDGYFSDTDTGGWDDDGWDSWDGGFPPNTDLPDPDGDWDGDGESSDGESSDGESSDGESSDGESSDTTGETSDSADTDDTGRPPGCEAPGVYIDCDGTADALTTDPWQAIGINCVGSQSQTIPAATSMHSNNPDAWRVAATFGSAAGINPNYLGNPNVAAELWSPNAGVWLNPDLEPIPSNTSNAMLMLSTGVIAPTDADGAVLETIGQATNGDNGNEDSGELPAPLSAALGSNQGMGGTPFMGCDLANDCSDTLDQSWNINGWSNPDDKLWMQAELTVPPGTEGFVFDFAYFSSEFPDFYATEFNDQFIAWSTSEAYTGNLTFVNGAPLTITSLEDAGAFLHQFDAAELQDTGFEGHAGTGWFVARGPAVPDEQFQLTLFIADLGDSQLATTVLLDNFRWECVGCTPSEVDSCGIQRPQ